MRLNWKYAAENTIPSTFYNHENEKHWQAFCILCHINPRFQSYIAEHSPQGTRSSQNNKQNYVQHAEKRNMSLYLSANWKLRKGRDILCRRLFSQQIGFVVIREELLQKVPQRSAFGGKRHLFISVWRSGIHQANHWQHQHQHPHHHYYYQSLVTLVLVDVLCFILRSPLWTCLNYQVPQQIHQDVQAALLRQGFLDPQKGTISNLAQQLLWWCPTWLSTAQSRQEHMSVLGWGHYIQALCTSRIQKARIIYCINIYIYLYINIYIYICVCVCKSLYCKSIWALPPKRNW